MTDILKTWPAFMKRARVLEAFTHRWGGEFYFTLGRAKPKQKIIRLWWTHQGEIIGSFRVNRVVINDGSLPRLRSLSGEVSEWQIRPDAWVAICRPPFRRLHLRAEDRIYHDGFRGWRYFDFGTYRKLPESRLRA